MTSRSIQRASLISAEVALSKYSMCLESYDPMQVASGYFSRSIEPHMSPSTSGETTNALLFQVSSVELSCSIQLTFTSHAHVRHSEFTHVRHLCQSVKSTTRIVSRKFCFHLGSSQSLYPPSSGLTRYFSSNPKQVKDWYAITSKSIHLMHRFILDTRMAPGTTRRTSKTELL